MRVVVQKVTEAKVTVEGAGLFHLSERVAGAAWALKMPIRKKTLSGLAKSWCNCAFSTMKMAS
jgi:hypothetical protein